MSKKEKYKRFGYEDAYDTEKENDWTNRLNLDDCIEIMNNQFNEIVELKQQLAEKDEEIENLKKDCRYYQDEYYMIQDEKEHFAGQCFNLQDEIKRLSKNAKLRKKAYNSKYKQFQERCKQQIRHIVCDEIRHNFYIGKDSYCDKEGKEIITYHINNFILDQIEKGEIK